MKIAGRIQIFFFALLAVHATARAESPSTRSTAAAMAAPRGDDYPLKPDSQRQKDVPQGKSFSFVFDQSKVFPGTTRTITVYVPAQYRPEKPACLYVGLDGLGFGVPVVFDNLIHKKEMPVTIAVGVSPGQVPSALNPKENPRFNRSNEFDSLNCNLAKLILAEILPEVEKRKTPDEPDIRISKDPNDHCTGGGSTGGIGAFTLAWQRPDQFRRVFSAIGTYVGMRGGDQYPVLVRKTEPKPIRIFMQDGAQDEWMGGPEVGDWWMSNQQMQRALEFAGYQVEHIWGTGPHSGKQAAQVFPDAMRFLWKDWPQPVKAGESQNKFLKEILLAGEDWKIEDLPAGVFGLAADSHGDVWGVGDSAFRLSGDSKLHSPTTRATGDLAGAIAFGPSDNLFVGLIEPNEIRIYEGNGNRKIDLKEGKNPDLHVRSIAVTHGGDAYILSGKTVCGRSVLWLARADGSHVVLQEALRSATCIALSPDGHWLAIFDADGHTGVSYRVLPEGKLDAGQTFYSFHVPDEMPLGGATSACFDRDGRLYLATTMGVQVLDRNGRSRAILQLPSRGRPARLCFGGKDFDTLYVSTGGMLYKRTMKSKGLPPAAAPLKLPPWGAG